MRADKRDAIVAAALYSSMLTFGVMYSIESYARAKSEYWRQEQLKSASDYTLYLLRAYSACNLEKRKMEVAGRGRTPTP